MAFVNGISTFLAIFVAIAFAYQIFFFMAAMYRDARIFIAKKKGTYKGRGIPFSEEKRKYAFIIAARNEENVVGNLIDSIRRQNYPSELIDIHVIADNCTDNTAQVARDAGAFVVERFNTDQIGKGYALSYFFARMKAERGGFRDYDGYVIFDADNVLDKNYLRAIDAKHSEGYKIITGYRNSKNYATNWVSAGHSLAFIREAQFLNRPRNMFHCSATVSGTGYMFAPEILELHGGWNYHLLTEDIELSAEYIVRGERIGYAEDAMFYDEQPITFAQSWRQRVRWARGFLQVIVHYGGGLLKNMFKDKSMFLSRYDMFMFLAPSMIFNIVTVALSLIAVIVNIVNIDKAREMVPDVILAFISGIVVYYVINYVQGLIATIAEWDKIHAPNHKKILYTFTYPIYMCTYIPMAFVAIFAKIKWKPIEHTHTTTIDEFEKISDKGSPPPTEENSSEYSYVPVEGRQK